jgi:hypothetical protein
VGRRTLVKNKKAEWPVIVAAVAGLIVLLYYMGTVFLAEPVSVHTEPPAWFDAKTNKPKAPAASSSKPLAQPGTAGTAPTDRKGQSGQ